MFWEESERSPEFLVVGSGGQAVGSDERFGSSGVVYVHTHIPLLVVYIRIGRRVGSSGHKSIKKYSSLPTVEEKMVRTRGGGY